MTKADKSVDYLAAIEQLRQEEQNKRNQIHSPDFVPQEEDAVDYMAVSKAWDKALQGRDVVNMPAQKNEHDSQ